MGFRFFKRVKVLPGVTLNLSKSGVSVSVGPQGAKVTVGSGGANLTLGIPGTGLYWTGKLGDVLGGDKDKESPAQAGAAARPAAEQAWLEGVTALEQERFAEALGPLEQAWSEREQLRGARSKLSVTLPVTPEIVLALVPDRRGAGLAYAECLQAQDRRDEAVTVLTTLRAEADAPVVRAAMAEIELERNDPAAALAACGRSRDPVVGLYRARALLVAGRAEEALTEADKIRQAAPEALRADLDEVAQAARDLAADPRAPS
jgi:tetratricopeptide (TPR) repeat protein